jgi:hypothetical protein
MTNEEETKRFERWVSFIRKNYDTNSKDFLLYIWNLYDDLIKQITEITKIKNNGNSQK